MIKLPALGGGEPESWLPILGWAGYYSVSDLGRVRSEDRVIVTSDSRTWPLRGRLLRPTPDSQGYLVVFLSRANQSTRLAVHRLVLVTFDGPPPGGGYMACHGNGDKLDNRRNNLRWGTAADNAQDMVRHGTQAEVKKTHCPYGHELVVPNLARYALRRGHRYCKACARARTACWNAKQVGAPHIEFKGRADYEYTRLMQAS